MNSVVGKGITVEPRGAISGCGGGIASYKGGSVRNASMESFIASPKSFGNSNEVYNFY
jgi:hypothetical protein